LKPQLNAIANYAPVINNFGYDTAISNGQNGSAVVSFSQRIMAKPKQSACCHHLIRTKWTLIRKSQKMIVKAVRLQYIITFSDNNQF
jgi:hypothetical protein